MRFPTTCVHDTDDIGGHTLQDHFGLIRAEPKRFFMGDLFSCISAKFAGIRRCFHAEGNGMLSTLLRWAA